MQQSYWKKTERMGDEMLWAVKNGDLDAVETCLKKVRRR